MGAARAPGNHPLCSVRCVIARLSGISSSAAQSSGVGDPDHSLVVAARGGDRQALDTLLRRHVERIHGLCRRMCGNEADADDATQEALIAVARGIGRFDGRSAFATWIYRVATNSCLDELRRRRRRPALEGDQHDDWAPTMAPPTPDTAEHVVQRLDIDSALRRLSPELRAAVVLRDLCRLDYAGIADVLDIPPGTVRSRIARGRAQLADLLAPGNLRDGGERRSP